LSLVIGFGDIAHGQSNSPPAVDTPSSPQSLPLVDFRPKSQLVVPVHHKEHAAFPVVDCHTHFLHRLRHNPTALDDFVALMDRNRIAICASLDGQLGGTLEEHKQFLWTRYPDRFVIFANVNWRGDGTTVDPETWACHRARFGEDTAAAIREAVASGVSGLKVFKQFGLEHKNPDGSLIKIDDPRWNPIWEACGDCGIPVIIHTGDPEAFFEPVNAQNERYEELSRHPEWSFHGPQFPSRDELLAARNRVIERHPKTQFIGAHVANQAEDLSVVSRWLDQYPNLSIDPASRISELGRQPFTAREFLIKYADRVLFGTDGPWPEARLRYYWRFFETRDEYFPYSEKEPPPQGFWYIYGVDLPHDVLEKLYYRNAMRLIPGVTERLKRLPATLKPNTQ
jgi:predicted TIM-barrel fold metal-dependent hydrolase